MGIRERIDRRWSWTIAIFLFIFVEGMAMQARGPILASLEDAFGVSEAALGLVAPAGTIGFFIAILVTGLLAGRIDVRRTLVVGVLCLIAALFVMASSPLYLVFLLGLFVQGTAAGAFRGVDRVVLSHLHPAKRGRMFALYALVWAVGAVVGPLLVSLVLAVADWRAVFVIIALCFVPTALIAHRITLPSMRAERSLSRSALSTLLQRPQVAGASAGMVLVGALEGILFTWLAYYALSFYSPSIANLLLSVYLLAYIPARVVYTYVVGRIPHLALLILATIPVLPALAITFSGVTGPILFLSVFVAGAGISAGYPTLSAYAVEAAPAYSGPLNALTNGSVYVGFAIAPAVVGILASNYGIATALWGTVALAGAFIGVMAVTWALTGSADPPVGGASSG